MICMHVLQKWSLKQHLGFGDPACLEEYRFFPDTWILPTDMSDFKQQFGRLNDRGMSVNLHRKGSLWRTPERLERRFRINPWVYFWKILKLLVAFRFWSLSKWDSFIGCLKDQKCETHAGSFLRAICTLFYLQKFQMPDFASARRFTNVKKQTFIIKPDNGCQARWKSDAFSRSCAGESSRGCKDQEAPTQLRNVPAKNQWLPTCQLFNSLQWLHSCDVDYIWLSKICNSQTFAGEGNLFDPWRGEGSGGFFLHLCSSEVRSDGGGSIRSICSLGVEENFWIIRPWNLMDFFFMIHVNIPCFGFSTRYVYFVCVTNLLWL